MHLAANLKQDLAGNHPTSPTNSSAHRLKPTAVRAIIQWLADACHIRGAAGLASWMVYGVRAAVSPIVAAPSSRGDGEMDGVMG
jgi:hypothetical protein